jgi:catechol 2,3-dioxygenase-like lactoylglutathione lyase family enzyme
MTNTFADVRQGVYHQNMRLSGAMLYVRDLTRMAAFYETALGLKPNYETQSDTWLEFDAAGVGFALHAIPPAIAAEIEITSPPQTREDTPIKLIFEVEEFEAEIKRLESLGITLMKRPYGACDVVDPEGNIFQIGPRNQQN